MDTKLDPAPSRIGSIDPATQLAALVRSQLEHACDGVLRGHKVYESLRNLNEVIGTQYGDRVLYELIQNAHDAHAILEQGKIAIKLIVRTPEDGVLYVANGGAGFTFDNVEAIRNLAISSKEVGEGIGNKGLGFRSIEALTDDVRIYSKGGDNRSHSFDGYCFRFAKKDEIEKLLEDVPGSAPVRTEVSDTIPRYLVSVPLTDQSPEIASFAQEGYATVVALPLCTNDAVRLATEQVRSLTNLDVPLILFLDRIAEIRIDVFRSEEPPVQQVLRRREEQIGIVHQIAGCSLYRVDVGDQRRFLVVRRQVDKPRIIEAIKKSIPAAPQLRRWLKWKGEVIVSVAVSLDRKGVAAGRLYNFLPMGDAAVAPIAGYLDAPFFTDIDRRLAKLDLPLNDTLMAAAAEACAAATLFIVENDIHVPPETVFDLIAWGNPHTVRIDNALKGHGTSLRDARIIPAIPADGHSSWTSLAEVTLWPAGTYTVLKARDVARRVGSVLVPPQIGEQRIQRLKYLAGTVYRSLAPNADRLGQILESFALDLFKRRAPARVWAGFYEDAYQICKATGVSLESLSGRQLLMDRSGKLRPAFKESTETQRQVYVRGEVRGRARAGSGVPLPPQSLSRRYYFLDDRIQISDETLQAFVKTGLLRLYDPIEALGGLPAALGRHPSEERRKEALLWAFQLWKSTGERVERALSVADLHIPTRSGWRNAASAAFSASWTSIGVVVENYLVEASGLSSDCKRASESLLVSWSDWPKHSLDAKRDWHRFLETVGVSDGLKPLPSPIDQRGNPAYTWNNLLRSGNPSQGLDVSWCAEVGTINFTYPYTQYERKGEAWRIPGQLEHEKLSSSTKEALSHLIFEHLKAHADSFFEFGVGRYERSERDWDQRFLPTPLAVFLRSKPWIAANSRDGIVFRRPRACWSAHSRRGGVPRFMDRLPEERIVDLSESEQLSTLVFGDSVGVLDWQSEAKASQRLVDLAAIALDIPSNDRPVFRREYRKAWLDAAKAKAALPQDLSIVVSRRGQVEALKGNTESPLEVIVTDDLARFEAKALSEAGRAVLDIGDASVTEIVSILASTKAFAPLSLDGVRVQLMVDGSVFAPRTSDPLLISSGLDWLPELAAIGHDMRAEQLEKGVLRSTIEARTRGIRLRRCDRVSLSIDGNELSSQVGTLFYAVEHDDIPTLILVNALPLNWKTLALTAEAVSRLIDTRIRSLKPLISDLVLHRGKDRLDAPTEEDLAEVLNCDVQIIQEHILELRADTGRILHMLIPLIVYFGGVEAARRLQADADRLAGRFDAKAWLVGNSIATGKPPSEIVDACQQAIDRAELRRLLCLDYAGFNRALREIGEPLISNEEELRHRYDAYLQELKPDIIDRLRRHYFGDYRVGNPLDHYVDQKTLSFITFEEEWIETRDTLEREVVESHVERLLQEVLGEDVDVTLRPLERLVDANRKSAQQVVRDASPLIAVWCRKHNAQVPSPWESGDPQAIVRHLENKGLFDFLSLEVNDIPLVCRRAECWPLGMKETTNRNELGLLESDLQEETQRRENEQKRAAISQRTIVFGGAALDTGAGDFGGKFLEIATQAIGTDGAWFERSRRRVRLESFTETEMTDSGMSTGGKGGWRSRDRQLTEAQRQAMGMAGEWLAYQFLRKRHEGHVDEGSWVSENRRLFFGGSLGDDSAGFDFRVKTPQAEWLYEVKSSLEDACQFEITANELRVASGAAKDGRRRYRILYVPHVLSPRDWYVLELPNPMGERTRNQFKTIGGGSVRLRFEKL